MGSLALLACLVLLSAVAEQQQKKQTMLEIRPGDVRFFVWTRENPTELFTGRTDALRNSPFNVFKPVKFLIHGFKQNGTNSEFPANAVRAYVKLQNANVITVDWSTLASHDYTRAATSAAAVGELVARFIDFLISQQSSASAFHLIGFSLGAHVAGTAGHSIQRGRIARITGLDPASPEFERPPKLRHLTSSDAAFVDIIHTNALPLFGLGFKRPIGHADFYPNGGNWQLGCPLLSDFENPLRSCPHSRAYLYFVESINAQPDHQFIATRCQSFSNFIAGRCGFCQSLDAGNCVLIGEHTTPTARGNYYVFTNEQPPYLTNS